MKFFYDFSKVNRAQNMKYNFSVSPKIISLNTRQGSQEEQIALSVANITCPKFSSSLKLYDSLQANHTLPYESIVTQSLIPITYDTHTFAILLCF